MTQGLIVVGWDGSDAAQAAATWAARQAALTRRALMLVQAMTADPLGGGAGSADKGVAEHADSQLRAFGENLGELMPGVHVDVAQEQDDPASGLLRWSASADILALGAPAHRHPRLIGGFTDHLCAVAFSPVAVIAREKKGVVGGPVTVGASPGPAARRALDFAASEAVKMGAELIAVIADEQSSESGRATLSDVRRAAALAGTTATVVWDSGNPVEALVASSAGAAMLVLGSHHSDGQWNIRLGPVVNAVLGSVQCPTVTVGRVHHEDRNHAALTEMTPASRPPRPSHTD